MPSNRELVTEAFAAWSDGTGYVTSIFAEDMTWEIVGHSAASRKYANKQEFIDEVLAPFGALSHRGTVPPGDDPRRLCRRHK